MKHTVGKIQIALNKREDDMTKKAKVATKQEAALPAPTGELVFAVTRLHKIDGSGATKAFVDISVNDVLIINALRVVEGKDGLFVAMPREEGRDGKWYNTIMPLKREVKDAIERVVLEAYGG